MDDGYQVRVLADGLAFPEGPRWHDGVLWFSDLRARTVRTLTVDGELREVIRLNDSPSGLGFLPDGTPIVVSMQDRLVFCVVGNKAEIHADLRHMPGDFLNDMLVDEEGRAYVGLRSASLRPRSAPLSSESANDAIVIVEPDGAARLGPTGLISPNGTVLSADGATLIIAETYAQRIISYHRSRTGALSGRRIFAEVPGRYPDGICLDDDGAVWFGSPYTHEFVRVREGRAVTDRIALPGGVACALGGRDGRSLFLLGVDPRALPLVDADVRILRAAPDAGPFVSGQIATTMVEHAAAGRQ